MKHRLLQISDFLAYPYRDELTWWLTILGFLVGFLAWLYMFVIGVWALFGNPGSTPRYYILIAFATSGASTVIGNMNRRLWLSEHKDWVRP